MNRDDLSNSKVFLSLVALRLSMVSALSMVDDRGEIELLNEEGDQGKPTIGRSKGIWV